MKKLLFILAISLIACMAAVGIAAAAPYKAVFYDEVIKPNWLGNGQEIMKYFDSEGYDVLDSAGLAEFMTKRIADQKPSVVVFAVDRAPTTVMPKASSKVLLREYLNAGGKIVWLGDIPLYAIQNPDTGETTVVNDAGATGVLGVGQSGILWDAQAEEVAITPEGEKWGLVDTWNSQRAIKISKVAKGVQTLAVLPDGRAAAWLRNYGGPEGTGFIRLFDTSGNFTGDMASLKAVAEYGLK